MIAAERYRIIQELLAKKASVEVSELIELCNVSMETVRRDLAHLENLGVLKRVHGGAVKETIDAKQSKIVERETEKLEQKREIGEIAARLLTEGSSIAMDSGTTNHAFAKILKTAFKNLTVITNYFPIINELDLSELTVISTGGILQKGTKAFTGNIAEENIKKFHVDKAFITISGISLKEGLTDFGMNEIAVKKQFMSIAKEVYILADSSKFNVVSLMKVCDFDNITAIITDKGLDDGVKAAYEKRKIKIINSL